MEERCDPGSHRKLRHLILVSSVLTTRPWSIGQNRIGTSRVVSHTPVQQRANSGQDRFYTGLLTLYTQPYRSTHYSKIMYSKYRLHSVVISFRPQWVKPTCLTICAFVIIRASAVVPIDWVRAGARILTGDAGTFVSICSKTLKQHINESDEAVDTLMGSSTKCRVNPVSSLFPNAPLIRR